MIIKSKNIDPLIRQKAQKDAREHNIMLALPADNPFAVEYRAHIAIPEGNPYFAYFNAVVDWWETWLAGHNTPESNAAFIQALKERLTSFFTDETFSEKNYCCIGRLGANSVEGESGILPYLVTRSGESEFWIPDAFESFNMLITPHVCALVARFYGDHTGFKQHTKEVIYNALDLPDHVVATANSLFELLAGACSEYEDQDELPDLNYDEKTKREEMTYYLDNGTETVAYYLDDPAEANGLFCDLAKLLTANVNEFGRSVLVLTDKNIFVATSDEDVDDDASYFIVTPQSVQASYDFDGEEADTVWPLIIDD